MGDEGLRLACAMRGSITTLPRMTRPAQPPQTICRSTCAPAILQCLPHTALCFQLAPVASALGIVYKVRPTLTVDGNAACLLGRLKRVPCRWAQPPLGPLPEALECTSPQQ